ncbi:MAG TPA: hypothetical protein VKZ72_03385 [Acidimicrobiales bacterium]|nr:hypothetical protein [Acidimicrobiales bacterium]
MADTDDDELEFLPTEELDEDVRPGPEDAAIHVEDEPEASEGGGTGVEADTDPGDDDRVDEALDLTPDDEAVPDTAPDDEREEDVLRVVQRHMGRLGDDSDPPVTRDDELRPPVDGEFVCRSCFLRRPPALRVAPGTDLCVDCAPTPGPAR